VKSRKVEDGILNIGRGCGIWMTGSWNIEANGESLKSLAGAGGTSAECAGRLRDVGYRRRQRAGRRNGSPSLKISISDRRERLDWQSLEKRKWGDCRKSITCREYSENTGNNYANEIGPS
jgi:hypothetical protein